MSSNVIAVLIVAAYLLVSLLATLFVRQRGFMGMRLVLLIMLVWLVPFLGAGCASAVAWGWGKNVGGSESIPDMWIAAGSSPDGSNDQAGGHN